MQRRLDALRECSATWSVLIAFSGGVDSTVVARLPEVLGDNAVALTAVSPTFPPEELAAAEAMTQAAGIRHILVDSMNFEREGYARNAGDRCYFCKTELFELARARAGALGLAHVADGTILDDLGIGPAWWRRRNMPCAIRWWMRAATGRRPRDRPSLRAAWRRTSPACMSGESFPCGHPCHGARLQMVQGVEAARLIGLRNFRARWHEVEGQPLCRIEVDVGSLEVLVRPGSGRPRGGQRGGGLPVGDARSQGVPGGKPVVGVHLGRETGSTR